MAYKKKNTLTKTYVLGFFTLLGLFLVVLSGVKLLQNDLIYINIGSDQITIEEAGNYYVLLDTRGKRYNTTVEFETLANQVEVSEDDEVIYNVTVALKKDTDTSYLTIEQLDFDKQVRTKEYLGFGKIDLEEGDYTFVSDVNLDNDAFGDLALLSRSYVNKIGLFSLSAITTILFGLMTYKTFTAYQSVPMSKYQRKHLKK